MTTLFASASSRHSSTDYNDLVDSDVAVWETSKQQVSSLVPGKTCAGNWLGVLVHVGVQGSDHDVVDEVLWWQVPYLDALVSSQNEPILLGGKENNVDVALGIATTEEFAFNQVPDHGLSVFSSWGQVGSLWSHIEGVDLTGVAGEGVLQTHGLVVPDLDGSVPWSTHNDGVLGVLVELDAWDPVSVGVLLNGELALAYGVPNLQVLVSAATGNLSVVRWKCNSENISWVTHKSLTGDTLLDVPESQGTVPWSRQSISAVLWELDIWNEVGVAYITINN